MDSELPWTIKVPETMGTLKLVKQDPSKNVPLPIVSAFKRKSYPDGRVRKLKARFCVRGDKQVEGSIISSLMPLPSVDPLFRSF
jgi:hypothetical protein